MSKAKMEQQEHDIGPFAALVGEEIIGFILEHAPTKVLARVASALDHYTRAPKLIGIDEEMGAIRLIAAEEELVVAIFEWLKLNKEKFPEHRDFVSKFKNHVVKQSFYPVLSQFRFIHAPMLRHGFALDGLESVMSWTAKPVVDGQQIKLALFDAEGKELIRHNPLAISISSGDLDGAAVVPVLLADFAEIVKDQQNSSVKEFVLARADFRNKLLYASDAGRGTMDDSLTKLLETFKQAYHDLLWVLAILLNGEMPSKEWGLVSQFIGLYREVLITAGVLSDGRKHAAGQR